MKNIFRSMLVIGVSASIMTGGAFAVFTSQTTNTGNVLAAGTVIINADSDSSTEGIQTSAMFSVSDLKPGDSHTKSLLLRNDGTLGLSYNGSIHKDSGDDGLYNALNLKVGTTSGGNDVYDGSLAGFSSFLASRSLLASTSETLFYTVELPASVSDNALQGKSVSVSFNFTATQTP